MQFITPEYAREYKSCFIDKSYVVSLIVSIVFLGGALAINYYATHYATERAGNPVSDLVLDNIRVYDIDGAAVYGPVVLWLAVTILCLLQPKVIPFVLKTIALFIIVRSGFVTLTHLGPIPNRIVNSNAPAFLQAFTFGNDFFFSGHTGLPFLMALIFWAKPLVRYFFIIASFIFGIIMLAAHLHYSIDVVSAFFITYSIFHIARDVIFKKDFTRFNQAQK